MIKNTHPGKFVVFDSLDGSGQSTQISLLRDFLIQNGKRVITTKEPTKDSEAGKKIRQILDEKEMIGPDKLQQLFVEDRKEHLEKVVMPALKEGIFVLSDRYFFSTFAYGVSDGLDLEWLIRMNDNFLLPDSSIILKVSPKVCIERIDKRGTAKTHFEKEEKLAKVWETYEKMPQRFEKAIIVDGERAIQEIHEDVKNIVSNLL